MTALPRLQPHSIHGDAAHRARRTVLSVPGSNPEMIVKAHELPADEVMLDLEDAVAPVVKESARAAVAAALDDPAWEHKTLAVRVNAWNTVWTYRDVIDVVARGGRRLDTIVLPKVEEAAHVRALDLLLTQLEAEGSLPIGKIGIEPMIESPAGLTNIDAIATASPRVQALVFGPADFMASLGMRSLSVGEQPPGYDRGDAYHHALMTILVAARTHGKAAIDGPYLQIGNREGFRAAARRSAALGFDGKWVLHPTQIEVCNEVFTPTQAEFDHAERLLAAYDLAISAAGGARGAVVLGAEMVDEASAKMAFMIANMGRAAGMVPSEDVSEPDDDGDDE